MRIYGINYHVHRGYLLARTITRFFWSGRCGLVKSPGLERMLLVCLPVLKP